MVLFDSDFMDNGGVAGNLVSGMAPGAPRSELVSPFLDLTGYTNVPIAARFYSFYRSFQMMTGVLGVSPLIKEVFRRTWLKALLRWYCHQLPGGSARFITVQAEAYF